MFLPITESIYHVVGAKPHDNSIVPEVHFVHNSVLCVDFIYYCKDGLPVNDLMRLVLLVINH